MRIREAHIVLTATGRLLKCKSGGIMEDYIFVSIPKNVVEEVEQAVARDNYENVSEYVTKCVLHYMRNQTTPKKEAINLINKR